MSDIGDMTLGELIVDELDRLDDLSSYKGKWKNLSFCKKGGSYWGKQEHDSKEDAEGAAKRMMQKTKAHPEEWCLRCFKSGRETDFENHSHTIQIPTGK